MPHPRSTIVSGEARCVATRRSGAGQFMLGTPEAADATERIGRFLRERVL